MIRGPCCGLWPAHRGYAAAIVDADGLLLFAGRLPEPDGQDEWLSQADFRYGPCLDLVLSEPIARFSSVGRHALECGHRVWIAPYHLITAISCAVWSRPSPRQLATVLARLPLSKRLHGALRLAPPDPGPRQLRLL